MIPTSLNCVISWVLIKSIEYLGNSQIANRHEWLHKSTIELRVDTAKVVHQLMKMTLLNEDALLCLKQRVNIRFVSKLHYVFQYFIVKCTI